MAGSPGLKHLGSLTISWSICTASAIVMRQRKKACGNYSNVLVRSVDLCAKFTKMALDDAVGFLGEFLQIGIGA
jgi:hypothetical protein